NTASSIVAARYGQISCATGARVLSDSPRSPVRMPARNSKYCVYHGWSSPSLASSEATASGDACWPRMTCAGLPGIARMIMKTMKVIPSSTGISCRSRFPMYWSIGYHSLSSDSMNGKGEEAVTPFPLLSSVEIDVAQDVRTRRMCLEAGDVRRTRKERCGVRERHPRRVIMDDFLGLGIEFVPCVFIDFGLCLDQDLMKLCIVVVRIVVAADVISIKKGV